MAKSTLIPNPPSNTKPTGSLWHPEPLQLKNPSTTKTYQQWESEFQRSPLFPAVDSRGLKLKFRSGWPRLQSFPWPRDLADSPSVAAIRPQTPTKSTIARSALSDSRLRYAHIPLCLLPPYFCIRLGGLLPPKPNSLNLAAWGSFPLVHIPLGGLSINSF